MADSIKNTIKKLEELTTRILDNDLRIATFSDDDMMEAIDTLVDSKYHLKKAKNLSKEETMVFPLEDKEKIEYALEEVCRYAHLPLERLPMKMEIKNNEINIIIRMAPVWVLHKFFNSL